MCVCSSPGLLIFSYLLSLNTRLLPGVAIPSSVWLGFSLNFEEKKNKTAPMFLDVMHIVVGYVKSS